MYISHIELENFKSFKGHNSIPFSSGVNYLVGNNNAGKTTVFQAIDFLVNGGKKEDYINLDCSDQEVSVTVFVSQVGELQGTLKKYDSYRDEQDQMIFQRSSKEGTISQGKKTVKMDIKTVRMWNPSPENGEPKFENPSGAPSTVKALFSPQFVYADSHNEDFRDFGSTKITGKLIASLASDFYEDPVYKDFLTAHQKAFGKDGVKKYLTNVEDDLSQLLDNQFGESKVQFVFDAPAAPDMLKKGNIKILENGLLTDASEKGNGMQRALALAIIQVVAERTGRKGNDDKIRGMQFFVDEPEIYLHPLAQDRLMESLANLTPENQVFITTHSPYILRHFRKTTDSVNILSVQGDKRVRPMEKLNFKSPTIAEVTYKAFGVPTPELHSQLFSFLYMDWIGNHNGNGRFKDFNNYLGKDCNLDDDYHDFYARYNGGAFSKVPQDVTTPYAVRNMIDHPELCENGKNVLNESILKKGIDDLIAAISYIQVKSSNKAE
ncbi:MULTISPECIES: ATP-dependent nuclease [Lactobacillaceae]|uniref:ATP-dependent endonuclease n=1 Tax=Levilactobacillus tongjiangensis TaxID=2486023 RepID=A0ABW1SWA0_9LACO|nr:MULTISPECIES: ATP-binding protein [Lactobacillaceae]MBU7564509.1 AAA family ATPase [Pediococcus ethanolidurans]MCV3555806.1 ATP-binding protein [Pediococcus ethanolidurans]